MTHSGDGSGWIPTVPEDNAPLKEGAQEIRDLRAGLKIRIDKEHSALTTASGGGIHKQGVARAYFTTVAPTQQPDGATLLDTTANADDGRLFVNSTVGSEWQKVWTGTAWDWVKVVNSMIVANAITYGHITTITTGGIGRVAIGTFTYADAAQNTTVTLGWQPSFVIIMANTTAAAGSNNRLRMKHSGLASYDGRDASGDNLASCASFSTNGITFGTSNITSAFSYSYLAVSLWNS